MHLQTNGYERELITLDGPRARHFHVARSLLGGHRPARATFCFELCDSTDGHSSVMTDHLQDLRTDFSGKRILAHVGNHLLAILRNLRTTNLRKYSSRRGA